MDMLWLILSITTMLLLGVVLILFYRHIHKTREYTQVLESQNQWISETCSRQMVESESLRREIHDFSIRIHRSLVVVDTVDENRNWQTRIYQIQEYLKKNADEREVIVTDECFEIVKKIRAMQEQKGIQSEYLFSVKTPSSLECKLRRVCRKAGIASKSPHKIRKTYISTLVNQMKDLDFVRSQVGHKEIQTTLNSYTYSTERTEKKYSDLSAIFEKSAANFR